MQGLSTDTPEKPPLLLYLCNFSCIRFYDVLQLYCGYTVVVVINTDIKEGLR